MSTIIEHNAELQRSQPYTNDDLKHNRSNEYSQKQIEFFKASRDYIQNTSGKYENKKLLIGFIFFAGYLIFLALLYFFGAISTAQNLLGSLFIPVFCLVNLVALLMIFVVIPRQYQESVEMYKKMGTPLTEQPLGPVQAIEARAETTINRANRNSMRMVYSLYMDSIKLTISRDLYEVIEKNRLYKAYVTNDGGVWSLLSIETLEDH
ncbi:MAG: hypothetical protein U0Z26_03675 [Anaerolineales bacterium]